MHRRLVRLAVLLLAGCSVHAQPAVDPGKRWHFVDQAKALEQDGWSAERLAAVRAWLRERSNATGIVVAHRGRVVFHYGDIETVSYVASVRKSILSILYGVHVQRGVIRLDDTLAKLGIDDREELLPIEKRATVRDLIQARSGIYHPASNAGDHTKHAPKRGSVRPGSYMLYNNWDFNAAGTIFERCTKRSIYDELDRQLAKPLGFEDWNRRRHKRTGNRNKSEHLAYHMHLSTRDMARIGHLMLRRGRWRGRQLVPSRWIAEITEPATRRADMNPKSLRKGRYGYGAMWWVWDGPQATGPFRGAYTAQGYFGQWITVLPAAELVVAHKTKVVPDKSTPAKVYHDFLKRLLAARRQ